MFKVNVAQSDGAGAVNEDVVGFCNDAAWVIDGATGLGAALLEAPSDAAWLAAQADGAFRRLLHDDPGIATRDLVRATIEQCRSALRRDASRFPAEPHEHPSAAFAMVRVCGGDIEFATLGDCRIAYADAAGVARLFGETPLTAIEARTIALAERVMAREPGIAADALKEALLPQLRANRSLMNTPGGYWVLGTEPAAAEHLDMTTMPVAAGQCFAIASDGYLRLVELFAVAAPEDLLATADDGSFARSLSRLRSLEREPDSCRRYPRVKRHDDASFIHCHYGTEEGCAS